MVHVPISSHESTAHILTTSSITLSASSSAKSFKNELLTKSRSHARRPSGIGVTLGFREMCIRSNDSDISSYRKLVKVNVPFDNELQTSPFDTLRQMGNTMGREEQGHSLCFVKRGVYQIEYLWRQPTWYYSADEG